VDDLDAGDHHLGLGLELVERRSLAVDRPALGDVQLGGLHVQGLAQGVEDVALDDVADRNADRLAGVAHLGAADHAVLRGEADGADQVVTEVLGDLEGDGLGLAADDDVGLEGVVDLRQGADGELHVDDRALDRGDAPGGRARLGGPFNSRGHFSHSLPAAPARASAPPTISLISFVISAWRAWLAWRVKVLTSSSALSVAAFMALRREAHCEAADSRRAK